MLIAGDLKTKIEKDTGRFLIMEEDKHPECTYISRGHYGCPPYPKLGRDRVLRAGLVNLEATRIVSYAGMKRRGTEPNTPPYTVPGERDRRNTVQNLLGTTTPTPSPRHSPVRSPSPARSTSPYPSSGSSLQDMVRRNHKGVQPPGSTSDPTATYTGQTLAAFDQSQRSDGGYLAMSDGAKSLSNFKNKRPTESNFHSLGRKSGKKLSLADLQVDRAAFRARSSDRDFPSKDSGIGTSADLVLDQDGRVTSLAQSPSPHSKGRKTSHHQQHQAYDHLGPGGATSQTGYDHLPPPVALGRSNCPPVPPRSGISKGDSYFVF